MDRYKRACVCDLESVVVLSELLYCIRICDEFADEHESIAPAVARGS